MLTLGVQKVADRYGMDSVGGDRLSAKDLIHVLLRSDAHVLLTKSTHMLIDRSSLLLMLLGWSSAPLVCW
jgi:hypothetical protein